MNPLLSSFFCTLPPLVTWTFSTQLPLRVFVPFCFFPVQTENTPTEHSYSSANPTLSSKSCPSLTPFFRVPQTPSLLLLSVHAFPSGPTQPGQRFMSRLGWFLDHFMDASLVPLRSRACVSHFRIL